MRKLFDEVVEITKIKNHGLALHVTKCVEEMGELTQAVNKTLGNKKRSIEDTDENIRLNVLEEAADTYQCLISIMSDYNITYDELKQALTKKNKKWLNQINEIQK